jgi:hypothetical protein
MNENRLYSSCPMNNSCNQSAKTNYFFENSAELESIAMDAYIYGYPLVLVNITKAGMLANGSCINQFLNQRVFPNPKFTTIVRPNVDTLYSMAWLDLSRAPIVLHVPNTHNRYYLMEFLDAWTNVFASLGARTTGTKERKFVIVGPEWDGILPEGVTKIQAPTNTVWIIGRTQTNGVKDYPIVHKIQDKYTLTTFNAWENTIFYGDNTRQDQMNFNEQASPAEQVANMDAATFFQIMMTTMYMNPPSIEDPIINKKLTVLGLIPNRKFNFCNLSPSIQRALAYSVQYGPKEIKAEGAQNYIKNNNNGWNSILNNIGYYGVHYMLRAIIAMTGIGANLPQDSIYSTAFSDKDGKALKGSNQYMIHFDKEELPPVNAFWSITLYNTKGFLVNNTINRYAISPHLRNLTYNSNGSLDIFIQNQSPGKNKNSNWLPAPKGLFNLILRMYWPKQPVLNGEWQPPGIIKISENNQFL